MPKKRSKSDLDEKDLSIIECVIRNPQASVEFITTQVEFAASTVQKRLADMLDNERLARIIQVRDWSAAGYPLRYRIDLKVDQVALRQNRGGPDSELPEPNADEETEFVRGPLPRPTRPISSQKKLARYIKNQLAQHYRGRLVCLDATILLGQEFDMSLTIRARDTQVILDFVTNGLRVLGGVQSTMSSHEAWSCSDEEGV